MKITLKEIAELVNGKLFGDEKVIIKNLAKIEEAGEGDLKQILLNQKSAIANTLIEQKITNHFLSFVNTKR